MPPAPKLTHCVCDLVIHWSLVFRLHAIPKLNRPRRGFQPVLSSCLVKCRQVGLPKVSLGFIPLPFHGENGGVTEIFLACFFLVATAVLACSTVLLAAMANLRSFRSFSYSYSFIYGHCTSASLSLIRPTDFDRRLGNSRSSPGAALVDRSFRWLNSFVNRVKPAECF